MVKKNDWFSVFTLVLRFFLPKHFLPKGVHTAPPTGGGGSLGRGGWDLEKKVLNVMYVTDNTTHMGKS